MMNRRLTAASLGNRNTNRYSVTALYSMAAEQDVEVEDDLARAQKRLRELKGRISAQSKKNFVLERDVRYLDSRIALLIQNRMALDEVSFLRPGQATNESTSSLTNSCPPLNSNRK